MADYRLSIIIPVFNVENYLRECVESVLNQPHNGCQIILVDDGSTDGSGALCDEYRGRDICVIHQENGGPSAARNAGLEAAQGRYIAFLDADDRIAQDSLSSILQWIEGTAADICFMEATFFYPDGRSNSLGDCIEQRHIRKKTREEVFQYLSTRPKYPGSACTKIFRKGFLTEHSLRFSEDRRSGEDLGFVFHCLLAAREYDCLNIPYYEYRKNREGSITTQTNMMTFSGPKKFIEDVVETACDHQKPKNTIGQYALGFAAYEYSIILWEYSRLTGDDKRQAGEFLREFRWVMQYGKNRKCRMVRRMVQSLGISGASGCLDVYMTIRQSKLTSK